MSRNTDPATSRETAFEVPDAAPAATATAVPSPAPVAAPPIDAVTSPPPAGQTLVDAPSLIPDRSSMPSDLGFRDGAAPDSLMPEVTPDVEPADPFDLDMGQHGSSQFGAGAVDLPDGPAVADLPQTGQIDVGVDWDNLGDTGTLDGRGVDNFEGGSNATGPADPSDMISDGASGLTTESKPGTVGEWIGSIFGADSAADEAFDKANDAAAKAERGGDGDANSLTTPGVTVGEDGVSSKVTEPTGEVAAKATGLADFFMGKKNIDGSPTEKQKQMPTEFQDGLPPDHPDYVGTPSERPPGSATDDSIEQSIRQGLGGDRGGDVDPFDDPQASPTDGERIYDPHDSVVDPGPDGFLASGQIDESYLPDAIDAVDPYLADG